MTQDLSDFLDRIHDECTNRPSSAKQLIDEYKAANPVVDEVALAMEAASAREVVAEAPAVEEVKVPWAAPVSVPVRLGKKAGKK